MLGKLKKGEFFIGNKQPLYISEKGEHVEITSEENHPIFGKRYKILGRDEWFEENCFEYIKEVPEC